MTDRELLELAAKAAGYVLQETEDGYECNFDDSRIWNPITDDGDAFRLMVKLRLQPRQGINLVSVLHPDFKRDDENYRDHNNDPLAATRRAIVRAAAEIGRQMP